MDESHRMTAPARDRFATTLWSVVVRAGEKGDRSTEALATLCETYWHPLYAYARRRGYSVEDAQDRTQGFFVTVLARDFLARANPDRGRFRAFLVTAFKYYLANEHDYATAHKRGGGRHLASLDDAESRYNQELAHHLTPEALYDRQWALTIIANTFSELEREARRSGRLRQFEALRPLLTEDNISHKTVAAHLGMNEGAVNVAVHRLRQRFASVLRERIAETVDSTEAVEDELRYLLVAVKLRDAAP